MGETTACSEIETARGEAINHLAECLFWKMEHLDPTDRPDWNLLTDRQQEFYKLCISELFRYPEVLRLILDSSEGPTTT